MHGVRCSEVEALIEANPQALIQKPSPLHLARKNSFCGERVVDVLKATINAMSIDFVYYRLFLQFADGLQLTRLELGSERLDGLSLQWRSMLHWHIDLHCSCPTRFRQLVILLLLCLQRRRRSSQNTEFVATFSNTILIKVLDSGYLADADMLRS